MQIGELHCPTLKKVAAIVTKIELDSTFRKDAATCLAMILGVSRYITLYNGSCNLFRNVVARQVARKMAQCNITFD